MSAEVTRDLTGLLAHQVESYALALEQRDLARDCAATLEQELAALVRELGIFAVELDCMAADKRFDQVFRPVLTSVAHRIRGLL